LKIDPPPRPLPPSLHDAQCSPIVFDVSEDESYKKKKELGSETSSQKAAKSNKKVKKTAKDYGAENKQTDWADSELFKFI